MRFSFVFTALLLLFIQACKPEEKCCNPYDIPPGNRVMILCEGNFQWGNADFDMYIPDSQKLYSSVFKTQNGHSPGDVLQSGMYHDGRVWLVLNNSGKLTPVDLNGKLAGQEIKGLKSPRYLLPVQGDTAWVTDLYSNSIYVVNLSDATVLKQIPCRGWNEQMVKVNGEVAVANARGYLMFFQTNGQVSDSIRLGSGLRWLETDQSGRIWALASDSGKAGLYRVDPATRKIENSFQLPGNYAQSLAVSPDRDTIYFLSDGMYKMAVNAGAVPAAPWFREAGASYYAVACDPQNGNVYLSDAKDYVSRGEILVLGSGGQIHHRFQSGINPGAFLFFR